MSSAKKTTSRKRPASALEEKVKEAAPVDPPLAPQKPKANPFATDDAPKVIMSHAQRRKLKKPVVVVTAEMKEEMREKKREHRKYMRMLKSNGARRKVAKLLDKRRREESAVEEAMNAFDSSFRPRKKGRTE